MRFDANKWRSSFWMSFLICPFNTFKSQLSPVPLKTLPDFTLSTTLSAKCPPKSFNRVSQLPFERQTPSLFSLEADDKNKSNGLWNSNIFWQPSIENRPRMVIIGPGPLCPHLRFVYVIGLDSSEAWHKFKLFYFNCQAMCFVLIFVMSPDGATSQQ